MFSISDYIIPTLLIALLIFCIVKKTPAYDGFTTGAKKAIDLSFAIFPSLVSIFVAIELLRISGISTYIANFTSPFFALFGIPKEICELVLLRPFSGSGSLTILENILNTYGADTYIGRCASVVMGSSETIFYVFAIYFSGVKNKKLYFAIPIALIASFAGVITGCLLCHIM